MGEGLDDEGPVGEVLPDEEQVGGGRELADEELGDED